MEQQKKLAEEAEEIRLFNHKRHLLRRVIERLSKVKGIDKATWEEVIKALKEEEL